jgi:hypothetical protein
VLGLGFIFARSRGGVVFFRIWESGVVFIADLKGMITVFYLNVPNSSASVIF